MYPAEEALKELYRSDSTEKNLTAEFRRPGAAAPFLRIYDGTRFAAMALEESLSSSENLDFGSCEASQVKLTVTGLEEDVKGCEMTLYQTLDGMYPAAGMYPGPDMLPSGYIMPLGRYVVQSAERQAKKQYRDITALDFMCRFDINVMEWYSALPFPLSLREFRARLCRHIGVSEYVPDHLPNDGIMVEKTIETAQLMGRDVLAACEQVNGAFGRFDRNGILQHVVLNPNGGLFPSGGLCPSDSVYPALPGTVTDQSYDERISPCLIISGGMEEYTVQSIEKVQIRQEEGDIGAVYGTGENCLTVEGNFLLFGKSAEELRQTAAGIYGMVSNRMYVPYECSLKGLPYIEAGDSCLFDFDDGTLSSYVLKRSLKGISALKDSCSAAGEEIRSAQTNVNTEIIQLKGKAAVLKRNVDEVSANLVDFEKQTEALFKITAEQITAEVKRAQEAEAALTVRADQITASVKSLKEETEAQFKVTAGQITSEVTRAKDAEKSIIDQTSAAISLKVSKGEVSSQLSVESDKITLSGNRLIVNSTNFKLDGNGNATFSGTVSGASIIGGTINIGGGTFEVDKNGSVTMNSGEIDFGNVFYVSDSYLYLGDYKISNDATNIFRAKDDSVIIQTAVGGPLGTYTQLKLQSDAGMAILSDNTLKITNVIATRVKINTSSWNGSDYNGDVGSILDDIWGNRRWGLEKLKEMIERLKNRVEDLENMI